VLRKRTNEGRAKQTHDLKEINPLYKALTLIKITLIHLFQVSCNFIIVIRMAKPSEKAVG
jgi:hypothetical protein